MNLLTSFLPPLGTSQVDTAKNKHSINSITFDIKYRKHWMANPEFVKDLSSLLLKRSYF